MVVTPNHNAVDENSHSALQPFALLCDELAATASKLKKRALLVDYLAALPDSSAALAAIYLSGQPFAEADRRTLQVGSSLLSRVLAQVSGATDAAGTAAYRRHGDLGAAAFDLLTDASHAAAPSLTLNDLANAFTQLAANGKRAARHAMVQQLLQRATPLEAKYILKIMLGDLRIGVKQSLVEEAIATASETKLADVRRAVLYTGDIGAALLAARHGTLEQVTPSLFHPLGFMLASPVETAEGAFARHAKQVPSLYVEDKFDGMRAQAHCQDGRVALYSRNREDITASFPELVTALAQFFGPCILDGEILGWDHTRHRALPFATFSNRLGRKVVSRELLQSTPVAFMAFDCLLAEGRMLLDQPLTERREILARIARDAGAKTAALPTPENPSTLFELEPEHPPLPTAPVLLASVNEVSSVEELEAAFVAARERGNEGLMIKDPASLYTPGRRGYAWLKLKRELATLDVVITGAEFGHGRRAGILSDYTFAVRDSDGNLRNIGKAYSGLTDAEIAALSAWCMDHTLEDHGHFRTVEPGVILEVAFNNIMRSGRHDSGFALRFPRILRLRTDKPLAEVDRLDRAVEIYQSQPDKPAEP